MVLIYKINKFGKFYVKSIGWAVELTSKIIEAKRFPLKEAQKMTKNTYFKYEAAQ